jgi:hypothetical protein
VAAQASLLCFVDGDGPAAGVPAEPRAASYAAHAREVRWSGGVLAVEAELVAEAGGAVPDVQAVTVFSPETGVEWRLDDTDASAEPASDGTTRLQVRIDPERLAAGGPLPSGTWWPSIRLAGDEVILLRTTGRAAAGATCLPRPVVSFAQGQRLGLDVGGLKHPVVDRIPVPDASVVESVRGCWFTCPVPQVDLASGATVDGQLRLGGLTILGQLAGDEQGRAVLQAWVSGMSGSHRMKTKFSPARFADCGARLVIDGVGTMQVRPARRKARRGPGKAGPTAAAAADAAATTGSVLRRLRSQAGRVRRAAARRLRRG